MNDYQWERIRNLLENNYGLLTLTPEQWESLRREMENILKGEPR